MATKSEIQGWIRSAEEKKRKYQKIVDDCDKNIERLKPVYKKLGEIKDDFSDARRKTEDIFEEKVTWKGETHTSFCYAGDALDDTYEDYYGRLDDAQDAVNIKIGDLKAEKMKYIPLIGGILGQIAQWGIDVENALN